MRNQIKAPNYSVPTDKLSKETLEHLRDVNPQMILDYIERTTPFDVAMLRQVFILAKREAVATLEVLD